MGRWSIEKRCGLVAAIAASATAIPVAAGVVTVTRHADAGWIITVRDDAFTGERRCTLRNRAGNIVYRPGALGFRVRTRDTLGAVYRVNEGPPVRWSDRYPALLASGIDVDGAGIDDPTASIVWVPLPDVGDARIIDILAAPGQPVRRYQVEGIESAVATSQRLGCTAQTSFRG